MTEGRPEITTIKTQHNSFADFDKQLATTEARVAEIRGDKQVKDEPALRYDSGKVRYDLVPEDSFAQLALVYTRGAAKYAERNWEKGMSWSRCFGSLMRHAWAFWRGEDYDQETGCHHMAMAAWNCMALCTYSLRKAGTDDRPMADGANRSSTG